MRARRLLDQAKHTLADDLAGLGQAGRNLAQSIGWRIAAEAEVNRRRFAAGAYRTRRRFGAWLDENAPWVGDARREPKIFWEAVGGWGDTIAFSVGVIVLMFYAPVMAVLLTVAALSIGVTIMAVYMGKFGARLRGAAYRADLRRRWALFTWRARSQLHSTLRTIDRWVHSVPGLSRRPHAQT